MLIAVSLLSPVSIHTRISACISACIVSGTYYNEIVNRKHVLYLTS